MKINVPTTQGTREVTAYASGVPGIVVTRRVANLGWVLTHKVTGLAVSGASYRTRDEAKAAAGLISDLADWATDVRETCDLRTLGRAVVAALRGEVPRRDGLAEMARADSWTCPCGHTLEMDGACSDGHVSPLRAAGLI